MGFKSQLFIRTFAFLIVTVLSQNGKQTNLNYLYTYQVKEDKQNVQLSFEITAANYSLANAIQQADQVVGSIQQQVSQYCQQAKANRQECQFSSQITNQYIQPLYKVINKKNVFARFSVQYELTIKLNNVKRIAYLIDDIIQGKENIKMLEFKWKLQDESIRQSNAIQQGIQEGHRLCAKMNGKLQRIINVQQISDFEIVQPQQMTKEEATQQGQDELSENNQQQIPVLELNFKVECWLN